MALRLFLRFVQIALLLALALSFAGGYVFGQDTEEPIKFDFDIDTIRVFHGAAGDWDGTYTDPGTVVYHDGQFHMFRNGFQAWPAPVQIGYLTSPDGINWTEVSEDPIILATDWTFDVTAVLACSALVEDDGTWVVYFYTWPRANSDVTGSIVRATAADPLGPWTLDETPVLTVGSPGEWDSGMVTSASVVKTDEGYLMYYAGLSDDFDFSKPSYIGLATSEDGVTWTKQDNPETTAAPFAESDPIFAPTGDLEAWDGLHVGQPRVTVSPDGFVMLYRSQVSQDMGFGIALSADGLNWERLQAEAVFDSKDSKRRGIWYSELDYQDGTYFFYLEIGRGYLAQTDIYVGTYEGSFR